MFQKLALFILVVSLSSGCITTIIKNQIVINRIEEVTLMQEAHHYFYQNNWARKLILALESSDKEEAEYARTYFGKAVLAILAGAAMQTDSEKYQQLHGIAVTIYDPKVSATQNLLEAVHSTRVQEFVLKELLMQADYQRMSESDLDKIMAAAISYCEFKIQEGGEEGAQQMLSYALPKLQH